MGRFLGSHDRYYLQKRGREGSWDGAYYEEGTTIPVDYCGSPQKPCQLRKREMEKDASGALQERRSPKDDVIRLWIYEVGGRRIVFFCRILTHKTDGPRGWTRWNSLTAPLRIGVGSFYYSLLLFFLSVTISPQVDTYARKVSFCF